jgi:hypothetical protein
MQISNPQPQTLNNYNNPTPSAAAQAGPQSGFSRHPTGHIQKKGILALVFAIITMMVLIIAISLPWWGMQNDGSIDFGLFKYEVTSDDFYSSSDLEEKADDVGGTTNGIIINAIILLVGIIILLGCSIALFFLRWYNFSSKLNVIILVLILIAMILSILAPVYYAFAWPDAAEKTYEADLGISEIDFTGSKEISGDKYNYGPRAGWMIAFVGFVFALITMILIILAWREAKHLSTQPGY